MHTNTQPDDSQAISTAPAPVWVALFHILPRSPLRGAGEHFPQTRSSTWPASDWQQAGPTSMMADSGHNFVATLCMWMKATAAMQLPSIQTPNLHDLRVICSTVGKEIDGVVIAPRSSHAIIAMEAMRRASTSIVRSAGALGP